MCTPLYNETLRDCFTAVSYTHLHEIAGYLQFESWGDIKDWLEDTIAEGTDVSERVDREMCIRDRNHTEYQRSSCQQGN